MLSPNILDKCSPAYARGYRDGYYDAGSKADEYSPHSFGRTDYESGYESGRNDSFMSSRFAEMSADADAETYGRF